MLSFITYSIPPPPPPPPPPHPPMVSFDMNDPRLMAKTYLGAMFPLIVILAEQHFSLLGRHFGHLSKNILYTRPVQRTHKKCVTFNFNELFLFDLNLDFN